MRTTKLYYKFEDHTHIWYDKTDKKGGISEYAYVACSDKEYTKEESYWLAVEGYARYNLNQIFEEKNG